MSTQLSHRSAVLILNGTRITGLSDDDPPVEFEEVELATAVFGMDGGMYTNDTGKRGGEVTVKLLPASPSTKWLMRHAARIKGGARVNWSGSYGDPVLSYKVALNGGVLTKPPTAIVPGQSANFVFTFEEITPDFDTARFAASVGVELPTGEATINVGVSI